MRSRTLERRQRIEIGRKSEEEEGFLVLGRDICDMGKFPGRREGGGV